MFLNWDDTKANPAMLDTKGGTTEDAMRWVTRKAIKRSEDATGSAMQTNWLIKLQYLQYKSWIVEFSFGRSNYITTIYIFTKCDKNVPHAPQIHTHTHTKRNNCEIVHYMNMGRCSHIIYGECLFHAIPFIMNCRVGGGGGVVWNSLQFTKLSNSVRYAIPSPSLSPTPSPFALHTHHYK